MRYSTNEILDTYSQAFRDLINVKVWSRDKSVREHLRLNKDDDWNFICTAMDITGDAGAAIENFLQFGLDGPTRYDEIGEKYLRLYGVLNATYIQQAAVLKLYKLTNAPELKEAKNQIESLQIRETRHKLGAHSIDYMDNTTKRIESYSPVRATLSGFICEYFNNETLSSKRVDLRRCLHEHLKVLIDLMDKIYEKTVNTLYRGENEKREEFLEKLKDLRIIKDGGLVATSTEGGKIVIQTRASKI
jgi:hypothetical protein